MGGSLGTAVLGAIFTNRLTDELAGSPAADVGSGSIDPSALQDLPAAVRDGYTGAFTDALSTVFLVAAAIVLVAFLLSWWIEERPLRQTVETAGVGEAFASPTDGTRCNELTRELGRLVGRERTRAFIERTVDAAGLDLPPGPAWLLVQGEEGLPIGDPEAIAAGRPFDAAVARDLLAELAGRGLIAGDELTEAGHATAARLIGARRDCLHSLIADWQPGRRPARSTTPSRGSPASWGATRPPPAAGERGDVEPRRPAPLTRGRARTTTPGDERRCCGWTTC